MQKSDLCDLFILGLQTKLNFCKQIFFLISLKYIYDAKENDQRAENLPKITISYSTVECGLFKFHDIMYVQCTLQS